MQQATGTLDRMRLEGFERDCERLRPLGHAFVLKRFGGQLNREDAEDAVSEVILRLHVKAEEGDVPDNLRAAFFTAARNQAIDTLRARGARPQEVVIDAAGEVEADTSEPAVAAESREEAAVLKEALATMRPNYREAILLRFGVGMTVPEIAEHRGISLPAAKKLMLRATKQVKDQLLTVTSAEHCEEMQEFARRSLFEKYATDLATTEEADLVRRHLEHCGSCKGFLHRLHHGLHDLAGGILVAGTAGDQLTGKAGLVEQASGWLNGATESSQAAVEKVRMSGFKLGNAVQGAEGGTAGALGSTAGKVAAVCGAGAATAATCVAVGVTPAVDLPGAGKDERPQQASEQQQDTADVPPTVVPVTTSPSPQQEAGAQADPKPEPAPAPPPTPVQQQSSEFGVEGGGSASSAAPAPSGGSSGGGGGSSGGGSGGGAGGEFGIE